MILMSELTGFVASALVLTTFAMKDMRLLRVVAILSNLAFMAYGALDWLPPVLFLHMTLLPLNIARLWEMGGIPASKLGLIHHWNFAAPFKGRPIISQ